VHLVNNTLNKESNASRVQDFLRFLAAFTVVLYHFGSFSPRSISPAHPVLSNLLKGFHEWSSTGYQFVMVFFVLSGYLISVSVMRLWAALLPTLVLTIFWAQLEISLFGNYGLSFKPDENYNPAVFA
jgi:peptidoglycan/LPS O-acetylase OafA/YrhL